MRELEPTGVIAVRVPDGRLSAETTFLLRLAVVIGSLLVMLYPVRTILGRSVPMKASGANAGLQFDDFLMAVATAGGVALAVGCIVAIVIRRVHVQRWRAARDDTLASGEPRAADAVAALDAMFGPGGPHGSFKGWLRRRRSRTLAGSVNLPITIVSSCILPQVTELGRAPGLMEPEAIVQTAGRGSSPRRVIIGICGACMLAGGLVQLWVWGVLRGTGGGVSMMGIVAAGMSSLGGAYFLLNATVGARLARWIADRSGPGVVRFWCGPGWVRDRRRGQRTWCRHDSVLCVYRLGTVRVSCIVMEFAGPSGTRRLAFDSVDGEFARLWRAWTIPEARDPDTGAPVQAREL